jgi:hypothetical protein
MKNLTEKPDLLLINGKKVCVLTYFNSINILETQKLHESVFKHFNLTLNTYFCENMKACDFLDYWIKNIESDIFIFFELDCIPLDSKIYENIVNELLKEECIIGIEQTANHLDSNFIYAGPACFGITKDVYNKLGSVSFDGTYRSDIAQEHTYLAYEKNIKVKFLELISSKNSKWKLGTNRFFGNGCIYSLNDSKIYHQFQTNLEEQRNEFKLECQKIINHA